LFQDSLEEAGVLNDKDFEVIHQQAVEAVDKALKFAEESPLPDESELMMDVYV
jgi:pyruvate dehydrogenase E1 component alpha subunit